MIDQEITIGYKNHLVEEQFRDLLGNCPKIPSPKTEILSIYRNYLKAKKIDDKEGKLKEKIIFTNQEGVVKEFISYMHSILIDLENQVPHIRDDQNLPKRLDPIVEKNLPVCVFGKSFSLSRSRIQFSEKSKKGSKSEQSQMYIETPKGDEDLFQIEKVAELDRSNQADILFSYLFDVLHMMAERYKNYYEMEDSDKIHNAIYQGFYHYAEENQFSLLSVHDKKGLQQASDTVKFEENKQEQTEERSQIFNGLLNLILDGMSQKKIIQEVGNQNGSENLNQNDEVQQSLDRFRVGKYQVNLFQAIGNAYLAIDSLYQRGISKVVSESVTKIKQKKSLTSSFNQYSPEEEERKSMQLTNMILSSHLRHNIEQEVGLTADQFIAVQSALKNFNKIQLNLNEEDKEIVLDVVSGEVQILKMEKNGNSSSKKLIQNLESFLSHLDKKNSSVTTSLLRFFSQNKSESLKLPSSFNILCVMFQFLSGKNGADYKCGTRRAIVRICHKLQNRFKKKNELESLGKMEIENEVKNASTRNLSLVHVLKMIESQQVKRSKVCQEITSQKPFMESKLPLINEKQEYFVSDKQEISKWRSVDYAQSKFEHEINSVHVFSLKKKYQQAPKMQLLKISHSTNKKVVTILMSGFLSQDSDKYQEWLGLLKCAYDTEIYALKWESKNLESILEFTINTCKDIALAGAGASAIGGPYIKAAFILKEVFNKYHQNPFNPTFEMANKTGEYLAHLLMNLFEGHFINLVGFSLGTQVIASALEELNRHKRLDLINRVITLGGVADQRQILKCLNNPHPQSKHSDISIAWTNVYSTSDNILKYLLKASMPSIQPVGANEVQDPAGSQGESIMKKEQKNGSGKCFELDNIDVTSLVGGHLSYRTSMTAIGRLIGLKDE